MSQSLGFDNEKVVPYPTYLVPGSSGFSVTANSMCKPYNTPFFTIRFQEALHHFSSIFDILDETLPIEDQQRLLYEQERLGRDIINVIACEGSRRLERPETYKQWQIRNTRAGFKQLPSNQEILTEVRNMVKLDYHEDFLSMKMASGSCRDGKAEHSMLFLAGNLLHRYKRHCSYPL